MAHNCLLFDKCVMGQIINIKYQLNNRLFVDKQLLYIEILVQIFKLQLHKLMLLVGQSPK